jgi:small subunit ribosomal protein S3
MGQKANPTDIRTGIIRSWPSRWFALGKQYRVLFHQDNQIRSYIENRLPDAGISNIEIERDSSNISVAIASSKPGVIIGRSGTAIEDLKKELKRQFNATFDVTIREIKNPDLDAEILADLVGQQISRRVAFRRAAKSAVRKAMDGGAKGVKVEVNGRLNGAEISRTEFFAEGKIPLQTFRADISYASKRAETTYGTIGVKVWVFRGEVFKDRVQKKLQEDEAE